MLSKIKNNKLYLILGGVILLFILGNKVIDLIRDTGIVENKDKKIGELSVIKETYKKENNDLTHKIEIIKETKKVDDKIIINTIKENKKVTKHYNKVKRKLHKKIEIIKKTKIAKNINDEPVVVNKYIYDKTGEVMINQIWSVYDSVKDKK